MRENVGRVIRNDDFVLRVINSLGSGGWNIKHRINKELCLKKSKISLVAYQEWLWSKKSNYFPLSVRLVKQSREYQSSFERHISNLLGFMRCRLSLTAMRKTSLRYTESKVFKTTSGVNHKDNTTDITHGEMDDTNQEKQRNLWSAGGRHLEYKYTIWNTIKESCLGNLTGGKEKREKKKERKGREETEKEALDEPHTMLQI